MPRAALPVNHKGRRKNNNNGSDVHMPQPQPPPQSSYLLGSWIFYFLFPLIFCRVFGRFATRGVQKHENINKKVHLGGVQKNPSGAHNKNVAFPPPPSVVLLLLGLF
jgi:hypothetical protein